MATKLLLRLAQSAAAWMPDWMRAGMYRLGPISGLLRGALNRSLPQGVQEVEISAGPLRGQRMLLKLQSEKDYWLGNYEMDLVRVLGGLAGGRQVAFDVGANIGYMSLVLAQLMGEGGQVIAFEALPANLERLAQNISLNALDERVQVQPFAASNQSGQAVFKVHASGGMGKLASAQGRDENYADEIHVNTITLDETVFEQGLPAPELVKLDIEGGEGQAIKGMRRILQEKRPTLLIELHGQEAAQAVLSQLGKQDYAVRDLASGKVIADAEQALDWKSYVIAEPKRQNG